MISPLSDSVKDLIEKARIVSFDNWIESPEVIQRFQQADDDRRYLTDDDLQTVQANSLVPVVKLLRDRVSEIVDEARSRLLTTYPQLTQPGGGLYPAARSEACWRDFWHFLRCITYGIAVQKIEYTSPEGLHYMQLLYQELQVPLNAMVLGLEGLKEASLKRVDPEQRSQLAPYFDHLITQLKQF